MILRIFVIVLLLSWVAAPGFCQNRYYTQKGHIKFFSKAPMEDIAAETSQAVSFLDVGTGELVFSVPMKSFRFEKALMQEHFNENYVESDKYPKATFKGKIVQMPTLDLTKEATYPVQVEGILTIHGVSRKLKTPGSLEVKGKQLIGKCVFSITPQEFDIKIPFLVREHIAKRIDITANIQYVPYQPK